MEGECLFPEHLAATLLFGLRSHWPPTGGKAPVLGLQRVLQFLQFLY